MRPCLIPRERAGGKARERAGGNARGRAPRAISLVTFQLRHFYLPFTISRTGFNSNWSSRSPVQLNQVYTPLLNFKRIHPLFYALVSVNSIMTLTASLAPAAATDVAVTTAAPPQTDSAVIGVVIALVMVTVAVCGFLLYRYLCHNKGVYRTAGEPAPGVDPDQVYNDTVTTHKKEYFI